MLFFHAAALFLVLSMVGVEFAVSAFVNPYAWQLEPEPQAKLVSSMALVLGKVMPVWYAAGLVLLATETLLHRHTAAFPMLLAASAIWLATIVATLLFLVPLNNQVAHRAAGWQEAHHRWDARHRVRIVALAVAALLLAYAVVR